MQVMGVDRNFFPSETLLKVTLIYLSVEGANDFSHTRQVSTFTSLRLGTVYKYRIKTELANLTVQFTVL